MTVDPVASWKRIPFLRLLIPFSVGILLYWFYTLSLLFIASVLVTCLLILSLLSIATEWIKFRWRLAMGIVINSLLLLLGYVINLQSDVLKNEDGLIHRYRDSSIVLVRVDEPLAEKHKSFRTTASVTWIFANSLPRKVSGNIIIYFEKDSLVRQISYGSKLIFRKSLRQVQNAGNPGSFDYRRYCLSQGITHQVYLKSNEWSLLAEKSTNAIREFIYESREVLLTILRIYITNAREQGVAEALLIGHREHLDKELLQFYSRTGVVHVIAISGLHLGLIYFMLLVLLKPLSRIKMLRWSKPLIILVVLWIFSLLAGGAASVLRSAVMFTILVIGQNRKHRPSVFNSLAASAFLLLCIHPYFLLDAGFQLSYAAVLGILLYMKPIDNWFYTPNKLLSKFWSLNAVTISAQVLTFPVLLFHFHQFPVLFLFTNLLAVPLSSIILLGELVLCILSFFPAVATTLGKLLSFLIKFMNDSIEDQSKISFATVDGIPISAIEAILVLGCIIWFALWLLRKSNRALFFGLAFLILFSTARMTHIILRDRQNKIIVYNIPGHQAIDFIAGKRYSFLGAEVIQHNPGLRNFHLEPSRLLYRVNQSDSIEHIIHIRQLILFGRKKILLVSNNTAIHNSFRGLKLDLIIFSNNPSLSIYDLIKNVSCSQLVFDSSNSLWKIQQWKKQCERLHLRFHSVPEQGAFVLDF